MCSSIKGRFVVFPRVSSAYNIVGIHRIDVGFRGGCYVIIPKTVIFYISIRYPTPLTIYKITYLFFFFYAVRRSAYFVHQ